MTGVTMHNVMFGRALMLAALIAGNGSTPHLAGEIFKTMTGADRKSTRLNSSHIQKSRMPSSA